MRSIKGKRQIRKGMYWAESMMPDPIALSPLGCAHQRRIRTYEVRLHILLASERIDEYAIIPGRLQTIIAPSAKTSCIASEGNFQSRTFLGRLLSCH